MRILVTGVNGFVGRHLVSYLMEDKDNQILGIDSNVNGFFVEGNAYGHNLKVVEADIKSKKDVESIVSDFRPERLFHLAAQSSVSYSWKNPIETFEINVFGGINILESLRKICPSCKTLMVCTAEEYDKNENGNRPIDENFRINPSNPYAISKAALDFFSATYYKAYKLPLFVTRSFNHIGPGQREDFVCSDFAKQIALIEKGLEEPVIRVGNLEAVRDFLDVRDVVRAYSLILEKGIEGEVYNVCSGKKYKISEILYKLLSFSTRKDIEVKKDKSKLRPVDIDFIFGDNRKLKAHTGWKQTYSIDKSLLDTLNYWRARV
ncbi:MAG: GDP-mannose 4,6-dehydratase [Actinobacteria bacterium]|nr:GDP-mannose 4,6-dehydratase [Actinomycetota bacterium]